MINNLISFNFTLLLTYLIQGKVNQNVLAENISNKLHVEQEEVRSTICKLFVEQEGCSKICKLFVEQEGYCSIINLIVK